MAQSKYDIAMGLLDSYLEEDENPNSAQLKTLQQQKDQIKQKKNN